MALQKKDAETPEANTRAAETPEERDERKEQAGKDVDVVAAPSFDKNGNPDQTPGYKVLGEDVEIPGV